VLHRKKRQAGRQFKVSDAACWAGRGIAFNPEYKLWACENALQSGADSRFKTTVFFNGWIGSARIVEAHDALKVGVGDRLPVRATRDSGKNLLRARRFRACVCWNAGEDAPAARGVTHAGGSKRPIDGERLNVRLSRPVESYPPSCGCSVCKRPGPAIWDS